ncbi:VOC family protein [Paenibacillus sp. GSMTC-2017]|uniref:VOC family protein n=1 Tax=Paenibacillus sp. GSMTC-2017 TaxID=2794350 RepID=UPI0018D749C6|nr:VOC family protein [Paenibacillus sp. GSMTC-2017]MBH5319931.1 VOC family protein [Paenibacillus sp. GSMTC-2017]
MATLKPFIFSENAREQADFYIGALGGKINSVMTYGDSPEANDAVKDKVMHMCFDAGEVTFFMADAFEPITRGDGFSLNLEYVSGSEGRKAFDNLAIGGQVKQPLEPVFWGGMYGEIADKYGVLWMITCGEEG